MNTKATNPKDGIGSRKAPLSVLSWRVMYEVALGMLEGAIKYRRHNYRVYGVRASVYMDATDRHLKAFWEGEDIDPVSRLHHISKAMSSLHVLRDAMLHGNWEDDRPPKSPDGWMDEMNLKAAELLDRMEEERGKPAEPPHTEVEERAKMAGGVTSVTIETPFKGPYHEVVAPSVPND